MTFALRRNRLTTHFSEGIPVIKRRISVHCATHHKILMIMLTVIRTLYPRYIRNIFWRRG